MILCDLDGTLIPFAPTPEEVIIDDELLALLGNLISLPAALTAIVSGRPTEYLEKVLPLAGLILAGYHGSGLLLEDKKFIWLLPVEELGSLIEEFKEELLWQLQDFKGLYAEDKKVVFALHYRLADEKTAAEAREIFLKTASPFLKKAPLEILEGKKVIELRPKGLNKGLTVNYFKNKYPEATIVYFGDDRTDEDAFAALDASGIGIFVGLPLPTTKAKYYLESYQEVRNFLKQIIKIRKKDERN